MKLGVYNYTFLRASSNVDFPYRTLAFPITSIHSFIYYIYIYSYTYNILNICQAPDTVLTAKDKMVNKTHRVSDFLEYVFKEVQKIQ